VCFQACKLTIIQFKQYELELTGYISPFTNCHLPSRGVLAGMRSLQAAGRQARPTRNPFVVHLLHWALLLAFLSGAALQASAQAPVNSQGARNPSAFVTSTRPGPTPQARPESRPDRGSSGALSRPASQIQQSRAPSPSVQASFASSVASRTLASSQATASPVTAASNTESMAPGETRDANYQTRRLFPNYCEAVDIPTETSALSSSLDTRLDAAFGILGTTLILSGLALAIAGAAYRRCVQAFSVLLA
jgi:hypothetical protein